MGIAAALRHKNVTVSLKGINEISGISNFPFGEKNVWLFTRPSVSAFSVLKNNNELPYDDTNIELNNFEIWFNAFDSVETLGGILYSDEYKGFESIEIAEITVEYQKDTVLFSKVFRLLFLQKSAHNNFYPEPYLVICPDLELEGMGRTKEESLSDIYQLFDIYFNETKKISSNPHDHLEIIETKISKRSIWKDAFYQLYKDLHKKDMIIITNLKYRISVEE
jgi:hypothetical protein